MGLGSLRSRALKLRHDWWYRWAHDPLCDRLGSGVLSIGKLRLCRSCASMYAGGAIGIATAIAAPGVASGPAAPATWFGVAGSLGVASVPDTYGPLPRPAKDVIRSTTGFMLGLLRAFPLARRWYASAALGVATVASYRFLIAKRAQAKASDCDGCPELAALHAGELDVCSGFAQQAVSLRAYERDASALATRARMAQRA